MTILLTLVAACSPRVVAGDPKPAENLTPPLPNPNVVVTATDGLSELTMPRSWRNLSGSPEGDENAAIVVTDPIGEDSVAVYTLADPDEDFAEFRSDIVELEITSRPGTKQLEKPLTTTLGELPAVRYHVSRKAGPQSLTLYIVKGDHGYHLVKAINGSGYGLLLNVADSWREVTDPV